MKYIIVYWHRYPHGVQGEEMTACCREFDSLKEAIAFLEKRFYRIKSINWAGGYIEDNNGNWIYDITDCGDVSDSRRPEEKI